MMPNDAPTARNGAFLWICASWLGFLVRNVGFMVGELFIATIRKGKKCSGATTQNMSDEVEEFISRFPRKQTPNNSVEDLFEIQHTGEWNYQIEGGGTKIFIDGYRARTILEAKYINAPDRSPYIPSSKIPDFLRQKIVKQMRDEFQRIGNVINDPDNPFYSLEIITNHPEAKAFFEELLQEFNIPASVVIPE